MGYPLLVDRDAWYPFDQGSTIGQSGSEAGVIIRDDEHPLGARITLERTTPTAPYTITCGIYGWMVHTRFFKSKAEADSEYEAMRDALTAVLDLVPDGGEVESREKKNPVNQMISAFIERFP